MRLIRAPQDWQRQRHNLKDIGNRSSDTVTGAMVCQTTSLVMQPICRRRCISLASSATLIWRSAIFLWRWLRARAKISKTEDKSVMDRETGRASTRASTASDITLAASGAKMTVGLTNNNVNKHCLPFGGRSAASGAMPMH